MKKLIIIPVLLVVTLFSVYHYKIEGKKIYEQPNIMEKMEQNILMEQGEIYTAKKEHNKTEIKIFTVEIPAEINITRDNETSINTKVKNANHEEACNFFWYEDEEFIGMGSTLEKSFSKGEHIITVIAKDGEGHESNATTILIAWDYRKIETLHFDSNYGDLEYKELEIYDHKGRYLILDDGIFVNSINVYDEDDNRIEHKVIYYDYPDESRQWLYTFDENHNQLTTKNINLLSGKTQYYNVRTFNEEGNVTSSKSGNNEDDLHDDYIEYGNPYENEEYYDYNSTNTNEDSKVILNEAGAVTYEERNYEYAKFIEEYSYDDNNTMTQHISTMITDEIKYDITIYNYNDQKNVSSSEQIYKIGEEVTCHYKTTTTYNEDGMQDTEKQETIDGVCSEDADDNSFKKYSYDKNGRITNISSSLEKESDDNMTTLKVIKSYTNELEG